MAQVDEYKDLFETALQAIKIMTAVNREFMPRVLTPSQKELLREAADLLQELVEHLQEGF